MSTCLLCLQDVEADCNSLGALLKAMLGLLSKPQAAANLFASEAHSLAGASSTAAEVPAADAHPLVGLSLIPAELPTAAPSADPAAAVPTQLTANTEPVSDALHDCSQEGVIAPVGLKLQEAQQGTAARLSSVAERGSNVVTPQGNAAAERVGEEQKDTAAGQHGMAEVPFTMGAVAVVSPPCAPCPMELDPIALRQKKPSVSDAVPHMLADRPTAMELDPIALRQDKPSVSDAVPHMLVDRPTAMETMPTALNGVSTAVAGSQIQAYKQKATAAGHQLAIVSKAAKPNKEQSKASKGQLTGSASMALAVLEAGSKPLSRERNDEDGGNTTLCVILFGKAAKALCSVWIALAKPGDKSEPHIVMD